MKEKLMEAQKETQAIFNLIQRLDAPMTENNVCVMNGCLGSLRFIMNIFNEALKEDHDGNAEAE